MCARVYWYMYMCCMYMLTRIYLEYVCSCICDVYMSICTYKYHIISYHIISYHIISYHMSTSEDACLCVVFENVLYLQVLDHTPFCGSFYHAGGIQRILRGLQELPGNWQCKQSQDHAEICGQILREATRANRDSQFGNFA